VVKSERAGVPVKVRLAVAVFVGEAIMEVELLDEPLVVSSTLSIPEGPDVPR